MNAQKLATNAALSTAPFISSLNARVLHQLELAFVAQWLYDQDLSVRQAAAHTAFEAIDALKAVYVRNHEREPS